MLFMNLIHCRTERQYFCWINLAEMLKIRFFLFGVTAATHHNLTLQRVMRPIIGGDKARIRDFPHQVCYADTSHQFIQNFMVYERFVSQEHYIFARLSV